MDNVSRSDTVEIPLTFNKVAVIDSDDFESISPYKWRAERTKRGTYYAVATIGRKNVRMHQLVMPDAVERDHKDGDGLNNRRSNLRSVTHAQNMHNSLKARTPNASSRFKGVAFQKRLKSRPWQARIGDKHLGYFETEEEAGTAYDLAANAERGEYAKTNNLDVPITPNHRYRIVRKEFRAQPILGHPEARILEYELECGHVHSISACKAEKIGTESRCKTCIGAI